MDTLTRMAVFLLGAFLVAGTLLSAIQTFVLPRSANVLLTRIVFRSLFRVLSIGLRKARTYEARDRIMALYAPVGLLMLPPAWLVLVLIGYTGMYWALGVEPIYTAFRLSGSSLLTLGFATQEGVILSLLQFSQAALGMILIALLISYMPTIYSAFSRRETLVTMLEVRAGSPPSAVEMLKRYHRLHGLNSLHDVWVAWETWFSEIEESHTSLAALVFFRSPQPDHSWVTAAGAVLDAASLTRSTVDLPRDVQADLCIRAGYLALRRIADFFRVTHNPDPKPGDPIGVSRQEFDDACDELAAQGVPLKPDRDQAWRDFTGWRVNYDTVLLALAGITMAPYAPWSSDRSVLPPQATRSVRQARRR